MKFKFFKSVNFSSAKSVCVFFLLLLFSCSNPSSKSPNIILIMADDLGYGDISCFGNKTIQTPVLDKMASEGLKFTDYHSNGAVCTPTRAALMTGSYQQRAGLEGVIYARLDGRIYGISQNEKTIAEYMKDAGYTTGAFGKWHLGYKPEFNPVHHGFDQFYGYVSGNVDYISHRDGIGLHDWWLNADTSYEKGYVTDLISNHALEFIENNQDKPFFLYLPHEAPHYPYQGRNDKADRLPGAEFEAHGSRPDKKQAYKEMIEIMDENIGRIFEKLNQLNLQNNTLVFFCSDNGATNMGSNGSLNGFKTSLWEGGHRVPAIAWYPKKIDAGQTTDATILSMDILPTFLKIIGTTPEDNLDGIDFANLMFNNKNPEERPVFWRYRGQWAVRKGEWKYLKIKEDEYLFNLKNDLGEKDNLMGSNAEKADELKALLKQWETEMDTYKQQTN
ncbi:sulfatase-like hydrolase/transferase [Maribellus comscasis]|uniref:Sulfatase-like hydrolase/transferase n=1 Tax=Maribellus comscasis TaxID=2681766 RepID=A0A6I6JY70_9BACT|nr:sulfatase-like hydrolase/transferase [Maribellus comscasis]QGY44083.1 sulfatase-like hydrolase/transferase [Maribellus comscasis]